MEEKGFSFIFPLCTNLVERKTVLKENFVGKFKNLSSC